MGIRERINEHPAVTTGVIAGAVVLTIATLLLSGSRSGPQADQATKAWFTDDDGKTWFPDDAGKIPPFDRNGKRAVRCFVQRCPDGTEWAAYLMRYSVEGKRQLDRQSASVKLDPAATSAMRDAIEIKPPGGGEDGWVPLRSGAGAAIKSPRCPHGMKDHASLALPG